MLMRAVCKSHVTMMSSVLRVECGFQAARMSVKRRAQLVEAPPAAISFPTNDYDYGSCSTIAYGQEAGEKVTDGLFVIQANTVVRLRC